MWFPGGLGCFRASFGYGKRAAGSAGVSPALPGVEVLPSVLENVTAPEILRYLQSLSNPDNVAGMARFGIQARQVYGVPLPQLKKLARQVGRDHRLAQELWRSGVYEARVVAFFVDDPAKVTGRQMDRWARDFDNWAVCDGCCLHLFAKGPLAHDKAVAWCRQSREFVKRAGFSMMAVLAVHDKEAGNLQFLNWLRLIRDGSTDERHFVKESCELGVASDRQTKSTLNKASIRTARAIQVGSAAARWIAADALRELKSDAVQKRLQNRAGGAKRNEVWV